MALQRATAASRSVADCRKLGGSSVEAQGLEQVISVWEDDEADKRSEGLVSEDSLEDFELSELLERMRSLVRRRSHMSN
jgi:hypothetical protein